MSYNTTKLTSTLTMNSLASISPSTNDYLVGGSSALATNSQLPVVQQPLVYYWQGTEGGTGSAYNYNISNGRNRFTWRKTGGPLTSMSLKDPAGNTYSDVHYDSSYVTPQDRDSSSTPVTSATSKWHMGFTLEEGVYLLYARISTNHRDSGAWIECAWHDENDNIVGPRQMMADRGAPAQKVHTDMVIALVEVGASGGTYGVKATEISDPQRVAIHMTGNDIRTSLVMIERLG